MDRPGLPYFGLRPDPGEVLAPEVAADRCVHSHLEQASCRACVDACPRGAFVLDDERLGIATARCDACGLCVPACPQGAVRSAFLPVTYQVDGISVAFAACQVARSGIDEPGVLPCLHALGLRQLLALRYAGATRLALALGDCRTCPRGAVTPIDTHLDAARQILESRGLAPLTPVFVDAEAWARAREAAAHQPSQGLDRRAFFRRARDVAVEQVVRRSDENPQPGDAAASTGPGRWFPTTAPGQLVPFVPDIDPRLCSGCDACARLCPEGAIQVEANAYRLEPDTCTGCLICVDVCTEDAVRVSVLSVPSCTEVLLHPGRCAACGVLFHSPRLDASATGLCPICAVTGHHRRLFQVLS